MSDRIKTELDAMFAKKEESKAAFRQEKDLLLQQQREFLEAFLHVREETIRPVFERFKAQLEARGHTVGINSGGGEDQHRPGWIEISFRFSDAGQSRTPSFKVAGNAFEQKAVLTENTHSHINRPGGSLSLKALTPDTLEQKILALLREVIR